MRLGSEREIVGLQADPGMEVNRYALCLGRYFIKTLLRVVII